MKVMQKLGCTVALVGLLAAGSANATPFGFAADGGGNFISQGYQWFNYYGSENGTSSWANDTVFEHGIGYGIGPTALGAAWNNRFHPGFTRFFPNAPPSILTMTSSTAGQTFDIGSLSLNTPRTESVILDGYLNGLLVDSWTGLITNQFSYTNVTLNWTGIDRLNISAQGDFFVTNIDTSQNVPEPATIALFGLGLLGFAAARRRKQ